MGERNVIWISFLFVVYYLIAGIVLTNIVVAVYIDAYLPGTHACKQHKHTHTNGMHIYIRRHTQRACARDVPLLTKECIRCF